MLRHFVLCTIEIRFVTACARDAGPRIMGHEQLRGALEEIKSMHMAIDPAREPLCQEIAKAAFEALRAQVESPEQFHGRREFKIPTDLIVRESTSFPRGTMTHLRKKP
jgi:hypothetical protein